MTMTAWHGNHEGTLTLHVGLCLTDDDEAARHYGRRGFVHRAELNLAGLTVLDIDGYDHDANAAPGDHGEDYGADVIVFWDETDCARRHETWRLMTPAALAALAVTGSEPADDED